jgi:hypothetical protein
VLESLRESPTPVDFAVDPADVVEEFAAQTFDSEEMIRSITLERMHFASAAPWWTALPTDAKPHHMNALSTPERKCIGAPE